MATRLYEVLSFVNVAAGAQATLPHHINTNGVAQIPDFLYPDAGGFVLVAADAATVTVQNNNTGVASLDVALFFIYSPERLFGQAASHLTPQPFFVSGGGATAPGANLWAPGTGAGSAIQNNGSGNAAGGKDSIAAGEGNTVIGEASFSTGTGNIEAGDAASFCNYLEGNGNTITSVEFTHIEGNQNAIAALALGDCDFNHVEGNRNSLLNTATHACQFNHVEGNDSTVTDADSCHVEGFQHTVNVLGGTANHVEGNRNALSTVSGVAVNFAHIEGNRCSGTASTVHVQGDSASAIRETQFSYASGKFGVAGDAQGTILVLRGVTPGAAPGEAVELKFGSAANQTLQLEDGKGYMITVEVTAKDTVAGGKGVQCWMQRYAVRRAAGLTTIAATGAGDQFGDPASATWTLVASIGAAPDRFALTFTTVGAQAAARCVATARIVEVLNA